MRGDVAAVRALLQQRADVNGAQGDGMDALHWAAEQGNQELAGLLLAAGAIPDAVTRIGRHTPLHIAAKGGHISSFDGSSMRKPTSRDDHHGAAPLHFAAASGSAETIALLLDHGAISMRRSRNGDRRP